MSPAEQHLGKLTRLRKFICWLYGTHPKDGVQFSAKDGDEARAKFAKAFGVDIDQVNVGQPSNLLKK